MKNVFKAIYALIAIALVYVLYLIALNGRYELVDHHIIDKWEQKYVWPGSNDGWSNWAN
jgi:hypothetical protein